jgi:DNA repair exonuclease SbcCD ATPase subunit
MSVEDGIPEPGQAPEPPQHDWEKDYKELQATYTQSQQRLKELERYESDPQAFIELGKQRGWVEIEEAQQQQQADDPYADRWQRLEAAESRLAEHDARVAAENAAAGEELFHADLDTWAEQEGVKLSKADHNAIFGLLMKAPDPTQETVARQIFDAHVADRKAEREALEAEIREQLKRPRVPHVPTSGGTETGVVDYDSMSRAEADRVMAEQVRAANQR